MCSDARSIGANPPNCLDSRYPTKTLPLFPTSDVIESTNLAAVSPATVAPTATMPRSSSPSAALRDEAGSSRRIVSRRSGNVRSDVSG